jgi:predicted transcriptional regulator
LKKLFVSIKAPSDSLSDFKKALGKARKGRLTRDHFQISFDNKYDFDRFITNLGILFAILNYKPKSVYELAKLLKMDVSNLNKLISFFESVGALSLKKSIKSGRTIRTPVVEYQHIEFDLSAA